jgi:hypothetical protein
MAFPRLMARFYGRETLRRFVGAETELKYCG